MERIVTKIGDVTIERRVSKPQQSKLPLETDGSSQQHQALSITVSTSKTEEIKESTEEQPGLNENIPKPPISNNPFLVGGNVDLKSFILSNKSNTQEVSDLQKPDNELQDNAFQYSRFKSVETQNSGPSLPKVPKVESVESQTQLINFTNGPDLSKLVGISIERRKRVDIEPKSPKPTPEDSKPSLSVIPSVEGSKEIKQEIYIKSECDDSFEKETSPSFGEGDVKIPEDALSKEISEKPLEKIKTELEPEIQPKEELEVQIKKEVETTDEKDSDINDLECNDLVALMQKGEIEGEIEDVKGEEGEEGEEVEGEMESQEKKPKKRKTDDETKEKSGNVRKKRKVKKEKKEGEGGDEEEEEEEDEDEDEDGEGKEKEKNIDKSKITNANLRKNIREVMDETKLDEATLAAQRQEAERLKRLQEQQRIIREVQRQIALNRQNQKSQNKVFSLLQGNSQTSILKTSAMSSQTQTPQAKGQNSVLVKLSNGEQTSLNNRKMLELLRSSKNKPEVGKPALSKTLLKQGLVTPSVTIAPIIKKDSPEDDKKKKKDVVTISSDSEDDCIVLSDEDESEPEEDPTNSGMHTNDKYNLPDENGRVLVNVGHPEAESDLYLAPQIARIIKPHQIGGIRFLYDNVIESIERFPSSAGFGCILAHSMGLGKTLQIVSFSDIFLRYTPAKTILCIMPINTIQNWLAEFNMWLPRESTAEDVRCREFELFIVNESLKNLNARAKVILEWQKSGGVLLMGYELFRLLSLKKLNKSKKKKKDMEEENARNKELIEEIYSALVLPGPDLVICDEGHRIKNSHATTSQALKQIRTKRRIVLTGYPLQNNLMEYWCMVDFVRPNYLGSKTEFSNMFERPIQNGQCIDSTPQDKRLMRYRAHVLHSLLEGFVQRRSHAVLQSTLPEKEEYVLLLRFTPFQRKLYDTFMNEVVRTVAVPNPLKAFAVCCKIWNHPDVLYNFLKKKGEEIDLDLEEALPPSLQNPLTPYTQHLMGPGALNQQGQLPWPRRGPGSRGGKVRLPGVRKNGRGRKPAATIPPNVTDNQEKNDTFNSGHFPANENFPNQQQDVMDGFQNRNYNQNQFNFNNDFNNQSGSYSNPNFNKNPLNNLENMSTGSFQNKSFFHQQNMSGNQGQYGVPCQNFDSNNLDPNFNPNNSNESNLNTNFESTGDTNFNPNDFSSNFGSDFFSNNNFQNSGNTSNYPTDTKTGFQGNSYFPNSGFRESENFNFQTSGNSMERNFPTYEQSTTNFQNSNTNFPNSFANPNRNEGFQTPVNNQRPSDQFQNSTSENRFSNPAPTSRSNFPSDFPGANTNFEGNQNINFPGQNSGNFQENNSGFGDNFQGQNRNSNFPGQNSSNNFQGFWGGQTNWGFPEPSKDNSEFRSSSSSSTGTNEFLPQKFKFEESQEVKTEEKPCVSGSNNSAIFSKTDCDFQNFEKSETDSKFSEFEDSKVSSKTKDEEEEKKDDVKSVESQTKKEDSSLPYDWATDLFKNYVTGVIENSSKMEVFFHIVTESIKLGDRLLVFSQSLLTLDLIEDYLHCRNIPDKEEVWTKHKNYFRLDGSTPGLEREKLINEFNANMNIYLFLVSTRAGSLGINLVGANRVVVFDASWNPCHDTQAVCRVYRYGQRKPCFVYRLVMDSCLEKKIYDRQVNKQGMADRVVDELNPDAHLSIKEVTNLCWDDQEDTTITDFSHLKDKYNDEIIKILLERCSKLLSKEPFKHESLLIDRKEKKLSQAEKRLAKRSYELEKQAANQPKNIYSFFPNTGQRNFVKPIASVRPMQSELNTRLNPQFQSRSKWIPAEVWQKQGMSAQEMTLPLDVMIPTSSPEKTSIVLKAGQRVMVLKSPKGIYMQLENGKIIAIRSAFKVGQNGPGNTSTTKSDEIKKDSPISVTPSLKPNPNYTPKITPQTIRPGAIKQPQSPFNKGFNKVIDKKLPVNMPMGRSKQIMGKAKPFMLNKKLETISPEMKQRMMSGKMGFGNQEENSNAKVTPAEDVLAVNEKIQPNVQESTKVEEHVIDDDLKAEEKQEDKNRINDSLETLRKVTESISDSSKREDLDGDTKYSQMNLKNYRHNFSSQFKENSEEEKKTDVKFEPQDGQKEGNVPGNVLQQPGNVQQQGTVQHQGNVPQLQGNVSQLQGNVPQHQGNAPQSQGNTSQHQGNVSQSQNNEGVQNWLMNQSYPPMDPYGNYFPGYYYGPSPGPMMPPLDGFYPPGNYSRNSPAGKQIEVPKENPQPAQSFSTQNAQNSSNSRNLPGVNTPPVYPPYPSPYSYPYNYPTNPNFNNQSFSFPNQNQSTQQNFGQNHPQTSSTPNSNQPYDNSMYSAFHRPDLPFQNPENPYPTPYPRPPYPNSGGTPGFFPYNTPYPNYPYGPNFNPYMPPSGYGYPMQNPTVNNQTQNQTPENSASSTRNTSSNANNT